MNINSFTYRLFSALVLILFMSSIVLPSGVSAASLFCDMEMTEMHTGPTDCCEVDLKDKTDHHRKNSADKDCHSEKICLHVLTPDHSETEAIVSLSGKKLLALPVSIGGIIFPGIHEHANHSDLFTTVPTVSPPIFLLNSTFLN